MPLRRNTNWTSRSPCECWWPPARASSQTLQSRRSPRSRSRPQKHDTGVTEQRDSVCNHARSLMCDSYRRNGGQEEASSYLLNETRSDFSRSDQAIWRAPRPASSTRRGQDTAGPSPPIIDLPALNQGTINKENPPHKKCVWGGWGGSEYNGQPEYSPRQSLTRNPYGLLPERGEYCSPSRMILRGIITFLFHICEVTK